MNPPKKRREKRGKRPPSRRLLRALYPQMYRTETNPTAQDLLPDDWQMRKK